MKVYYISNEQAVMHQELSGLTDYLAVFPLQVFAPHLFPFLFIPATGETRDTDWGQVSEVEDDNVGGGVCGTQNWRRHRFRRTSYNVMDYSCYFGS